MAKRQSGAVSLFAVIFAALLLTILTIGFIKLMVNEQQQATANDLSQSALDSALAGVEDAKRVIRDCQNGISTACDALNDTSSLTKCNVIERALSVSGSIDGKETIIQSNSADGQEFNQAYTCVNIFMDTDDYVYTAKDDQVEVVPLKVAAGQKISEIRISWFADSDIQEGASIESPPDIGPDGELPIKSDWLNNAPPMVRAQLISPGETFSLSSLDSGASSQTAFLRPLKDLLPNLSPIPAKVFFDLSNPMKRPGDGDLDAVRANENSADLVACYEDFVFDNSKYACSVTISLEGAPIVAEASTNAILRLSTLYGNGAEVRVSLWDGDTLVKFNGVQPKVDSTGRAGDLFRRVEARLRVGSEFVYPGYAVDTKNSLCKNFAVVRGEVPTSGKSDCE